MGSGEATDDRDLPDVDILGGDRCYADGMLCRERDYEEKRTRKTTPHLRVLVHEAFKIEYRFKLIPKSFCKRLYGW